jgi:integrase
MPAARASTPRLCRVAGRDAWHIYDNRRRISTGETDRAAAERFLADYRGAAERPAAGSTVTVSEVLARYLADRKALKKPGADRLEWAHKQLNRHLADTLPDLVDARAYKDARLAEGVAVSTARTELQALRAAFRWAAAPPRPGPTPRQPLLSAAPPVELPPRGQPRDRWLTRDEAARLVAACKHRHVKLFVLLGLHTAARREAILALTWDRVDLERRQIDFREPGRAATAKRRAVVPINDTLLAALRETNDRRSGSAVVEWAGGRVASVRHGVQSAAKLAGVAGVTPHVLRHTAVTWMMQSGVDIWQVAGMAKMTVEVLQEVYGHHHPDFLADAARALG